MNNKGFAVSTMLYGLAILGFLLIIMLMSTVTSNRINTKELVSSIEEDLNRYSVSQTTITSSSPNVAENFIVTANHGGWYKIELWSGQITSDKNADYKSMTVKLPEYAKVSFYIGGQSEATKETIACLSELGRSSCTQDGQYTILTTENKNDFRTSGSVEQTYQYTSNDVTVNRTATVSFDETYNRVFLEETTTGTGRARITLVSKDDHLIESKDPTERDGNYYILSKDKDENGKWVALTADDDEGEIVKSNGFNGSKNQTWTITKEDGYYTIINVGTGKALSSTSEALFGHNLNTNNKYVKNNDTRRQDWIIDKLGEDSYNIYSYIATNELDTLLADHCGYVITDGRFCIGKKATYDAGEDECTYSENFKGEITLTINSKCQSLQFINAEI